MEFNPDKEFAKDVAGEDGPRYATALDAVYALGITYAYDLNMANEGNVNPSGANFLGPWASKFTLGVGGSFNGKRANDRKFAETDNMRSLFTDLARPPRGRTDGPLYCDSQIAGPNQTYPIAGEIGVYKTLADFLDLVLFTNIAMPKSSPTAPLVDQLTFTTTIDVSLTPKVVFTPIGPDFQATDL